jgi:hypothetical protein
MVLETTDFGGVEERRWTAAAVGGGGGGAANSTSIDTVANDSVSPIGIDGDESAMGRAHSTTGSGTTAVQP